jgi:hypothetical protein
MFWIFTDYKYDALAPDNSAFGAALAYRWRNFHDNAPYNLHLLDSQVFDYTRSFLLRPDYTK